MTWTCRGIGPSSGSPAANSCVPPGRISAVVNGKRTIAVVQALLKDMKVWLEKHHPKLT